MRLERILETARGLASRAPSREAIYMLVGHAQNELMGGRMSPQQFQEVEEILGLDQAEVDRYSGEMLGVAEESA